MNILLVSPILPVPTSGGGARTFNLIKQLCKRHQVSVIAFIRPPEHDLVSTLEPLCAQIELLPFNGFPPIGKWRNRVRGWWQILFHERPSYVNIFPIDEMRMPLQRLLETRRFDVVLFESLLTAELLDEVGRDVPAILDEQNVESDIARRVYAQASKLIHKLRDWLIWRRLLAYERLWVKRFPICAAVSERDAFVLRRMSPGTRVYVVPNGVDVQSFTPRASRRESQTLLFFGTMDYSPNVDGLVWFCERVFPTIREFKPKVRLDVVGANPPPVVNALGRLPGVNVVGFVPDIRTRLWSATACVVPLRIGGGTRLKILEALAAGCPVISTSVGAEGLFLEDGKHLMVADSPEEFAQISIKLLEHDDLRDELARAGRHAVAQHYDWQRIASMLEEVCIQAVRGHATE